MTNQQLANNLAAQFPDAPSKSLGRRLYEENKERFMTLNAACLAVRRARGNQGKLHRRDMPATSPRPNGKSGWAPECPPSQATPWEPLVLDTPCRVLSLSDAHVPYHEPKAIEAAVEHARKKFKPDVVLINGDWCDFYAISRWERDPKKRDFVAELGRCEESLRWLRGRFPKARIIYKEGNHEERYAHYIWNKAPELWGLDACRLENILHLADIGIEMVTERRPVLMGHLPALHGHELTRGLTSPVNQARGAFLRTIHTVLVGHGHSTSTHVQPDLFKREITCWSQGCLCYLHPQFMPVNTWNHGNATVDVAKNGEFDLMNYRISADWKVRTS